MGPLEANTQGVVDSALAPLRSVPRSPFTMGRFALAGVPSAAHLVRRFASDEAKALLGGVSAHAMLPLDAPVSAAFGIFLTLSAHATGWPVVEGGSAVLVDALVQAFNEAGGVVHTGRWINEVSDLPVARATLFDTSPSTMVDVLGDRLPERYRRQVSRFRYGPGVCKVTGPSLARCRGSLTRVVERRPCTSAVRSMRSPRPRPRSRRAATLSGPTASSSSRASSITLELPRAKRPFGRTVTYQMAPTLT